MSIAARLHGRITRLAVGRHLPHRTVRIRLTLLYGGLFLLSGAALMAITYALLVNAGFIFSLQNTSPSSGADPSAQSIAHWRTVAQCMREHAVTGFPNPTTTAPPLGSPGAGVISDRPGAFFAIPSTVEHSPQFTEAANTCGLNADQPAAAAYQRTQVRQELLIQSGIALAAMALLSLGLGWLIAGRVLQPLTDSYQAQRQFVANASHELRGPLTRLRTLSEVALASPQATAASLRTAHERVLASEQHLEQLIGALLALTRGQAGLERRERCDLALAVTRILQAHAAEVERLNLDVHATLDQARAAGDPRLLERLVANLIDNAIRHNIPGGRVEITTGTRDRHAFASVANTGPAVPPDQLQRLFEPFQRLSTARTGHNSGHGLGLSIVQAIANAHQAKLSARPHPHGGLTIEVSFPPPVGTSRGMTLATAWRKHSSPRATIGD